MNPLNYIEPEDPLHIIRFIFYIWFGICFSIVCFMYYKAAGEMKKTPIMISLSSLFGSLAFLFFYLSARPIVYISKNYSLYDFLVLCLPIVMIPLLISLHKFINLSITTDDKKIKKEIDKK